MPNELQSRLERIKQLCALEGIDSESIERDFKEYIGQQPLVDASGNFSDFPDTARDHFLKDLLLMYLAIDEIFCYDDDLIKYRMRFDRLYKILKSISVSSINLTDIPEPSLPKIQFSKPYKVIELDEQMVERQSFYIF